MQVHKEPSGDQVTGAQRQEGLGFREDELYIEGTNLFCLSLQLAR